MWIRSEHNVSYDREAAAAFVPAAVLASGKEPARCAARATREDERHGLGGRLKGSDEVEHRRRRHCTGKVLHRKRVEETIRSCHDTVSKSLRVTTQLPKGDFQELFRKDVQP